MGLFNRNKISKEILKEAGNGNVQNYEIGGVEAYNFVRGLRLIATDTYNNDYLLDRMLDDSIISAAVDMYIDDALQVDPQKQEIFWVEVDNTDDKYEEKLSEGLALELNRFLKSDLRMDEELKAIARRYIQYGMCVCRLDFIDRLEDDRLNLIDKNKKTFESVDGNDLQSKVIESISSVFNVLSNDGTQALSELKSENSSLYEDISYEDVVESLNESLKSDKKSLKEDMLTNAKRLIKGRWSTEIIGQGTNVWELRGKGKTLAYLDVRKPNFLLDPKNLVCFSNNTGKYQINLEVGPYDEVSSKKEYFILRRGESYLDNARIAWQVLAALEDILMLTRMTRSMLYRIFSVEVGNKGDTETRTILNQLKNRIKFDETINVRDKIYNSEVRQLPLADSIFLPTRNGIGSISINTVGGDVNLKDAVDLDYFKDKLFAALKIPKAFLGFSDESSGGMVNTALTRLDIRYARTIRGIQNALSSGLKELCLKYLSLTREENTLEELPDFKIVFTSINTEEDNLRNESKKTQMETLDKILESFENLGVSVSGNKDLRNELIKEYIGSNYLDIIKKAEKNGEVTEPVDTEDKGNFDTGVFGNDSFSSDIPDLSNDDNIESPDENAEENTEEENDLGDLGAGDEDFNEPEEREAPSGLKRELNK